MLYMGITYWTIMLGFITGAVVKTLMPKVEQGCIFTTMTMGLLGSVFFGWLGSVFKLYEFGKPVSLVASLIGALSLLFFYYSYIKTYGYQAPPKGPKYVRPQWIL